MRYLYLIDGRVACAMILALGASVASAQAISIPDGTVVLEATGSGYAGGAVSATTLDVASPARVHAEVTAMTRPNGTKGPWFEINLMPLATLEATEGTANGPWDQGVYVSSWYDSSGDGLSLKADNAGTTINGPYAWGLDTPASGSEWMIDIYLTPTGPGTGTATMTLSVGGVAQAVGGNPSPVSYDVGDLSDAALVIQFITATESDVFTYQNVWARAAGVGDADIDGDVDQDDLNTLASSWKQTGADWLTGDFNGDGVVNEFDLALLAAHWQDGVVGQTLSYDAAVAAAFAVPEPTAGLSLVLLAGGLGLARDRRRTGAR